MAGYKTWAVNEEVLAADLNSYVQSQVVARFPSASARTAQLPAPAVNQLSLLDTSPRQVDYWTGAAWARLLPQIFAGNTSVTTDGTGFFAITFPGGPLPWTPTWAIVQKHGNSIINQHCNPTIMGLSATILSGQVFNLNDPPAAIAGQAMTFSYIVGAAV